MLVVLVVVGRTLVDEDEPRATRLEVLWPHRGLRLERTTLSVLMDLDDSGAARGPAELLAPGRGDDNFAVVAFGGHVYWAAARRRVLARTPSAGGPTVDLATPGADPFALAVDASGAYALTQAGDLVRVPLEGGAPTTLAGGLRGAHGIASDEDAVWVTDEPGGRVLRVAKEGGRPVLVAGGQPRPLDVVTDGDRVFWSNSGDGSLGAVSRWGGAPERVVGDQRRLHGVAVDGTHVYWVTPRSVRRAPLAGGATEVLFDGLHFGWAIAVARTHVLAAVPEAGAVLAIPLPSGAPRVLALPQGKPEALATDGEYAFWADEVGGALYRAPLPR